MIYINCVIIVSLVILVHELGHLVAAKQAGIPIRLFSIGMGPKVWTARINGTEYRLSMLPFGGYVLPDIENEADFFDLPISRRIIMSIGGPLANIILSFCCFVVLNVIQDGATLNTVSRAFSDVCMVMRRMVGMIPALFGHTQLSGVVGIVAEGGRFIGNSFLKSLEFTAILSLNLAVMNLIPLPVLDGGKVLLYLMEKVHPKFYKLHYGLAVISWILMIGLTIYATVGDVYRLIS